MRSSLLWVAAVPLALWCQTSANDLFSKAPPEIDAALRERAAKFYQLHVEGKFRAADQYVAEDSKDAYFESDHIRYQSCEIAKIVYSDQFTKAKLLSACKGSFRGGGHEFPVVYPIQSLWKIEGGQWFWYTVPSTSMVTPAGIMTAGPSNTGNAAPPAIPNIPAAAKEILRQVRIDRREVMLSSYEPASAEVVISNAMPGSITLRLQYQAFPGFEAKLEKTEVPAGGQSKLLLSIHPKDPAPKPTTTVAVVVEQTGQSLPVKVTFDVPPEMKKLLPK